MHAESGRDARDCVTGPRVREAMRDDGSHVGRKQVPELMPHDLLEAVIVGIGKGHTQRTTDVVETSQDEAVHPGVCHGQQLA